MSSFRPSLRGEVFHLPVGGGGQFGQHIAQVSVRIQTTPAAAFDEGVEDGAAFSGLGLAEEQPILFAQGRGPDGIFHEVIVDLDAAVFEVNAQLRPQVERK